MAQTFQERFCQHCHVPPESYAVEVLQRALYPHARFLGPLLILMRPDFFAADRDFVSGVGLLRRRRDFAMEMRDFQYHPANRGFLRQVLRCRASSQRMSRIFYEVWSDVSEPPSPDPTSASPFEKPKPPTGPAAEQT